MKTRIAVAALVLLTIGSITVTAQTGTVERRALREYTAPEELVSIAPTTTLDRAIAAISEVSRKFVGKIVIDPERREYPINVDVQAMPWRQALEAICRKNDIWYSEFESYIALTGAGVAAGQGGGPMVAGMTPGSVDMVREPATIRSREILVSAIFFEVSLSKVEEVGINWSFMKSTSNVDINGSFLGGDRVSSQIFELGVTPKLSFANMDFLARLFSNYDMGEILSSPQIILRSGETGRIQVGEDFSVKERDFAGNLIDRFYSAGTIINVTAQVLNEQGVNFVHLKADVERSNVVPGVVSTIINKTKASTNLLLLDGEETIIGGLYNHEVVTQRTGVPFLKDLPWYIFGLRYLFGYDKDQDTKKELVILMKADLVPTLQERISQKMEPEKLYRQWKEDRYKDENRVRGIRQQVEGDPTGGSR
jgi:type IV pilus assembly protein PilQ